MSWLRLQGRGALVVLAGWAGMAAAQMPPPQVLPAPQTPAPAPAAPTAPTAPAVAASAAAERIVTVNENGKSIRCRIVRTWQLQDGSTAHQLQAVDTGEFITILDDLGASPTGKGMPKRIFHWGLRRTTPPAGTPMPPIPPELMVDSGVVITREINPPPPGGTVVPGPVVVAQATQAAPPAPPTPTQVTQATPPAPSPPTLPAPPVPTSPYAVGASAFAKMFGARTPAKPAPPAPSAESPYCECTPARPAILPAPVAVAGPIMPTCPCPAGCDTVAANELPAPTPTPAGPTMREKIQNWFAAKSTPAADKETRVAKKDPPPPVFPTMEVAQADPVPPPKALPPAKPRDPVAAAAAPLSSAQPTRMEVVMAPSKLDVTGTYPKAPTALPAAPPEKPAIVQAAAKPTPPESVADKADILASPEKFVPEDTRRRGKGKTAPAATSVAEATDPNALPPGAASVLAARNGLQGPIAYVPVQTPVVPKPWRPPVPPDPKTPEAPPLNAFVNAFTPPTQPQGPGAAPMAGPPMAMPYPPPGMPPYAMANPYGAPGPYAMPPYAGMNPAFMPPNLPPGSGYPVLPAGYGNPLVPPQAGVPGTSPRSYSGPMPPDPFGTNRPQMPVQPVGYTLPAPNGPAMPMAASAEAARQVEALVTMLRDSGYPSQREMAANYLAMGDARAQPQIVAALMRAARQDPAPTVRAACVINLARMNVATAAARGLYEALRTDADPRVREAAGGALARFGSATAAPAVVPAAAIVPQTN